MMNFFRDERGASLETLAVGAAVIAICCLLFAQVLDRFTRGGLLPMIAIISPDGSTTTIGRNFAALPHVQQGIGNAGSNFGDIDYTATGSLPQDGARPVVLDPCTGQQKQ